MGVGGGRGGGTGVDFSGPTKKKILHKKGKRLSEKCISPFFLGLSSPETVSIQEKIPTIMTFLCSWTR